MPSMSLNSEAPPIVLVVDNDPEQVDILARFLSRQGMTVLPAYNGQQCLEVVRQNPAIDVIVLDVMMPGMDGLEVCAALKQMAPARSIPIILLTARDDMETRLAGMRLGVSEFIAKPARGRDLLARIRTQVEVSRKAREMEQSPARRRKNFPR